MIWNMDLCSQLVKALDGISSLACGHIEALLSPLSQHMVRERLQMHRP